MISIIPATADTLIQNWKIVEPHLDRVCEYNHYRQLPIDILTDVARPNSEWAAWLVIEAIDDNTTILAVLVTAIRQFPRRRGLAVYALAGDRWEEWGERLPPIMDNFAMAMGCDHQELVGRLGWGKVFGIKPSMVMLYKDMRSPNTDMREMKINNGGANA